MWHSLKRNSVGVYLYNNALWACVGETILTITIYMGRPSLKVEVWHHSLPCLRIKKATWALSMHRFILSLLLTVAVMWQPSSHCCDIPAMMNWHLDWVLEKTPSPLPCFCFSHGISSQKQKVKVGGFPCHLPAILGCPILIIYSRQSRITTKR